MKYYFAYGSNLWLKQMEARCPDHRVIGSGILIGYRWIITARGYASVVRSVADLVFGTVYEISDADEERLDLYEEVGDGSYRKALLPVETETGAMGCLVYIDPLQQEGQPREEYVERIKHGIRDARLPSLYVERYLSSIGI
jgi:gamma-glutamylcyclotransferase